MTGTSSAARTEAPEAGAGRPTNTFERNLKIVVIAMGLLIVLGVLTVIGRIIYLASRGGAQSSSSGALATAPRLALPAGAAIRSLSMSGDRLAIHFDAASGAGIAILDLASGKVMSRVELVPEPPR